MVANCSGCNHSGSFADSEHPPLEAMATAIDDGMAHGRHGFPLSYVYK